MFNSKTEADIASSIPGLEVPTNDDDTQVPATQASEPASSVDSSTGTGEPTKVEGAEPQGDSTPKAQGKSPLKIDKDNNVVDESGNIIATAGSARRHYENFMRMKDTATVLQNQLRQAQEQQAQLRVLNDMPAKFGLSLGETESALQLMQAFKTDPVRTLKNMIAQAHASGLQLEDEQTQAGIDRESLRAIIKQELQPFAPLAQQHQAQVEVDEYRVKAEEQAAAFFAQFPDAVQHEQYIAKLIESTGNDLMTCYWQLREFVARNGLDWNQPLTEQWTAKTQQTNSPNQQPQTASMQQPRVHSSTGAAPVVDSSISNQLPPTANWSSIVKNAMRANGLQIE